MTQPKKVNRLKAITNANTVSTFKGFKRHPELEGKHAFLSPSNHSWQRYTDDHLLDVYSNEQKKERGTRLHAFVSEAINLGIKLEPNTQSVNQFVNDAIGFRMSSEVPLYYSDVVFGTADAIRFDDQKSELRIHDLKTGIRPVTSFEQLDAYAALFMLEYNCSPLDVTVIQRLYQNGEILEQVGNPDTIGELMGTMVKFTNLITKEG